MKENMFSHSPKTCDVPLGLPGNHAQEKNKAIWSEFKLEGANIEQGES